MVRKNPFQPLDALRLRTENSPMEEGGAKRIVVIVAIAAVAIIGVFWYWQRSRQRALGSGNVYVKNQAPNQTPDQGATLSSAPPSAVPEPDTAAASDNSSPPPPAQSAAQSAAAKPTPAVEKNAPHPTPPHAAPAPMTQPRGALAVPASDTIARNPPSGLIFAGAGKYQLYRQGDITWRLDTDTGRACIIFATDSQWSRNRVYDSGCGAS